RRRSYSRASGQVVAGMIASRRSAARRTEFGGPKTGMRGGPRIDAKMAGGGKKSRRGPGGPAPPPAPSPPRPPSPPPPGPRAESLPRPPEHRQAGGVHAAGGEAQLGGAVVRRPAADEVPPARFPGGGLEVRPHHLQGAGGQAAAVLVPPQRPGGVRPGEPVQG